jgi:hypothetical protein
MKAFLFSILLASFLFLSGCNALKNKNLGGLMEIVKTETRIEVEENGKTTETITTITVKGQQPENPERPTRAGIDPDGKATIELPSSNATPVTPKDPPKAESSSDKALGYVVIAGGIAMILGGFIAIKSMMTGGIVSAIGAVTMATAAGIDQSKAYIGIAVALAFVALIVVVGIMGWKWYKDKKDLTQTEKAISKVKVEDKDVWPVLKEKLEETQDEDVKARIKQRHAKD